MTYTEPNQSSPRAPKQILSLSCLRYHAILFKVRSCLAPCANLEVQHHHLSAVRDQLLDIFVALLCVWTTSHLLHPQPEDAPRRGNSDPRITGPIINALNNILYCQMQEQSKESSSRLSFT
jgi:hypothetical protein